MEQLEDRRVMAVITVDTIVDERDLDINDGDVSLRDAIIAAATSGDTIDFAASLNGATITLDRQNLGQLEIIGKNLTIDATSLMTNGLPGITIDAGGGTDGVVGTGDGIRIFNITDLTGGSAPPLVTLVGLTLTGGDVGMVGGVGGEGGAVRSEARLVVRDSMITGNKAEFSGDGVVDGAIYGDGVIDNADLDLAFAQFGLDIDWVA